MKKIKQILGSVFLLISSTNLAQGTLDQGKIQLNAGFGASGWGTPVYVGLDYGIKESITIGGEISYRSYSENYFNYKYKYTLIGVNFNANYHFNEVLNMPKKWDLYAGGSLGYYNWNNSYEYVGPNADIVNQYYNPNYSGNSGLGFGIQAGGRYFFNDKFAINLETGGGSVFGAKIGITLKLGSGHKKHHASRNHEKGKDASINSKVEIKSSNNNRNINEGKSVESQKEATNKEITKKKSIAPSSKRKSVVNKKKVTKVKK